MPKAFLFFVSLHYGLTLILSKMRTQDTSFSNKVLQIFEQGSKPLVMGILNITPDSFFDGGKYIKEADYIKQTEKMILEGADIIDIGAYSSRPGAKNISEEEEFKRLKNVIPTIKKQFPEIILSVDTFRAIIAQQTYDLGVDIINDISGGTMDKTMFETIAKIKTPYVLMHIQGTPQTMQANPNYNNVTNEVHNFFETQIKKLNDLGVKNIIVDPGFGFGKTLEHNYELLSNLEKFSNFKTPVLVGLSRKSMISKLLNIDKSEALNGTTVLNTIALMKGAKILRVHDVKEAKEVIRIYNAL